VIIIIIIIKKKEIRQLLRPAIEGQGESEMELIAHDGTSIHDHLDCTNLCKNTAISPFAILVLICYLSTKFRNYEQYCRLT